MSSSPLDRFIKPWKINTQDRTVVYFDTEDDTKWKGPFYFIQGADCQFGLIQREIEGNTKPGWEKEKKLSELAVEKINRLNPKPKFFVICGDLCDAFYDKEPEVREAQDRDFKRIFGKLDPDIPLVCICGNHDVGDNPTEKSVYRYTKTFGEDYFKFWAGGVYFIALNSQYYMNAELVRRFALEQDKWLDEQLEVASILERPTIMFQHIPWFLTNPDSKENNYFEIKHDLRKKMMDKFVSSGVKYVFCGHYHRNAGGKYKSLEVVTTSAIGGQLGNDKSGMRIVKVYADKVEHQYHDLETFPETVVL
uniref:Serine/threonine-protein phosphatase CPPED1 n=1 Tax=Clastoptera arizonana TaxID=38151 RepID=A0A1B6CXE1_9HEMI